MAVDSSDEVTQLLLAWGEGDVAARDRLIPLVHAELRRLAHAYMRRERDGHTLQTSALVNETYLRLVPGHVSWQNRTHFFSIAARLMRQVLIDHALARKAAKRGGAQQQVSLSAAADVVAGRAVEILALDEALKTLAEFDLRQSQIVELRFFGGLTTTEMATALGLSDSTVEREWRLARAWLRVELSKTVRDSDDP
jgi:RNA polymerase sigma factor (TIGR02999 family)